MSKEELTLGYILTKYRTQAGLDTKQMASKISVEESDIIALEKGTYHIFPSINHPIPIIKKLSYVLGLKYHLLVEIYYQEYAQYNEQSPYKKRALIINHKVLRRVGGFIIGGIIIGYVGLQIYQLNYTPVLTLKNTKSYEIYESSTYTLTGNITRAGQLTLNGQKVTLKEEGQFEIVLNLREGENRLELQVSKDNSILKTTQKIVYKK